MTNKYNMKKWIYILIVNIIVINTAFSQCFPDRHNTTWYDGWISCSASQNPNQERGISHWIMYDFGYTYHLGKSHIWNTNAVDYLQDGIQTAVIDVSVDGMNWMEVGEFTFEKAPGITTYEGFEGPDLTGIEAKYMLITAISNFGGQCYGFSELKVEVNGITNTPVMEAIDDCLGVRVFPNPVSQISSIDVITPCNNEQVKFRLLDITGKTIIEGEFTPLNEISPLNLNVGSLDNGTYFLHVFQQGASTREKIIKLN